MPSGQSFLVCGIGYCVTLPVAGSSEPRNIWPKSEYQTVPLLSSSTSCGSIFGLGMSYSVITTWVERPFSRGIVLSGQLHVSCALRLTDASHSALFRNSPLWPMPSRVALPARGCGFSGVEPG